jgi:hypothetical protein
MFSPASVQVIPNYMISSDFKLKTSALILSVAALCCYSELPLTLRSKVIITVIISR